MAVFHGIQVYAILENGNLLNAIYTNTGLFSNNNYDVDNEIARKKTFDNKGIEGLYDCRFIETNSPSVGNCDLEITKDKEVYVFIWKKGNKTLWKGLGLMTSTTHISVSYVEA